MNKITIVFLLTILLMTSLVSATETQATFPVQAEAPPETTTLDMETAGRIALENSPSIQAIKERVAQAREAVIQARAAYYPSLDATGSLTRQDYSQASNLPDPDEKYATELSATWVLFNGFSRKLSLQSAKYGRMSEMEAGHDARRLLLLSVAESYNNVQLAKENMATAEADTTFFAKQLKDARIKQEAGAGSLSDVLTFQVQVNGSEASRLDAEKEYRIALTGLAALMGYENARLPEGTTLPSLESSLEGEEGMPHLEELVARAEINRPDLKQLDYSLKQAEKQIGIAASGYYPTVSLNGSWNGEREASASFEGDDFGNTVGITVSMNLFSGGATRSKVNAAKAAKREAALTLADQKITVRKEVTSAWHELDNAKKQLKLQRSSTALVQQNRDLVEAEYKAGQSSLVRLTEAQSELVKNRSQYLQAAANLQLALEKIKAYTGESQLRR